MQKMEQVSSRKRIWKNGFESPLVRRCHMADSQG